MEHSALHALELLGQITALGGAFFVLVLVWPASSFLRAIDPKLVATLTAGAARWVVWGALGSALATALNIFVEAEETQGKTVFGGVDLALVVKFCMSTRVGRLTLWRIAVLLLTAVFARFMNVAKWWLVFASTFLAIILTSLVSHAAAQPTDRSLMLATQIIHIAGAALWVGVLVHLLVAERSTINWPGREGVALLSEIVRRFSPVALTITSLLGISGLWMLYKFLAEPSAVITSAYGLTLIVKLLLLTPAIYAGLINFRVMRPALQNLAHNDPSTSFDAGFENKKTNLLRRFGHALELEVTAGVLVITAAAILASVSPPGAAGAYRLTEPQARAILHPHLPVVNIVNPATFYGAAERTTDDLHYAEFTHNWSGVMVCLLGLGWLVQSAGGVPGKWAGRLWPLLLVPFAVFIALAADPEVWLFRKVSPLQVLGDPQLLEHQLGAVMVLILAWLGWRNHVRPGSRGPFGYGLPIVLTAGGILLLGHAHSTLNITEELTNLINVQHAIFGAFIILAGTVRWLTLRELFPRRAGDLLWPCFVIGLGVYMAFFYRETI